MNLCAACERVDYLGLFRICLRQFRGGQEATEKGQNHYAQQRIKSSNSAHHSDIFEIGKSSKHCKLCRVIFDAFEKRKAASEEDVRRQGTLRARKCSEGRSWSGATHLLGPSPVNRPKDLSRPSFHDLRDLPIIFCVSKSKIEVCYLAKESEGLIKLCGLDFYTNSLSVHQIFDGSNRPPILKTMKRNPGSKSSLKIASGWLEHCLDNHDCCRPSKESQKPPKRLINVGNETQNPFLVETSPDPQYLKWVSLSYCWGEEPSLKLTREKIGMLKNGIPLDDFDATIRDAILVTRALKISYLWIDAFCIMQEGNSEWNQEASKMNQIYGGSTVTLVASSSDSVKNGFLKKRELNYIPITWPHKRGENDTGADKKPAKVFLSLDWDEQEDKLNEPWSKRGWTMQEGLLPSRILLFKSFQMIWKCCEEQRFERGVTESLNDKMAQVITYSDESDLAFGSKWFWEMEMFMKYKRFKNYLPCSVDCQLLETPVTFRLWYEIIEDYTGRKFKNIGDRLMAISGLARLYWDTIQKPEYVVGLWREDLIRGLTWYIKDAKLISGNAPKHTQESNNAIPSWSWAGVGFEDVKYETKISDGFRTLSTVERVKIELVDQHDPFGAVKSGSLLTIKGPFKTIPRLYNKDWKSDSLQISKLERYISEIVEGSQVKKGSRVGEESQGVVEDRYISPPGGHFGVLQMLQDIDRLVLVVLQATEAFTANHEYRRVGVLTLTYADLTSIPPPAPEVIAMFQDTEESPPAPLERFANAEFLEVMTEKWNSEQVIIV